MIFCFVTIALAFFEPSRIPLESAHRLNLSSWSYSSRRFSFYLGKRHVLGLLYDWWYIVVIRYRRRLLDIIICRASLMDSCITCIPNKSSSSRSGCLTVRAMTSILNSFSRLVSVTLLYRFLGYRTRASQFVHAWQGKLTKSSSALSETRSQLCWGSSGCSSSTYIILLSVFSLIRAQAVLRTPGSPAWHL